MSLTLSKQGARLRSHSDDSIHLLKASTAKKPPAVAASPNTIHTRSTSAERSRRSSSGTNTTISNSSSSSNATAKRLMELSHNLDQKIVDAMHMCVSASSTDECDTSTATAQITSAETPPPIIANKSVESAKPMPKSEPVPSGKPPLHHAHHVVIPHTTPAEAAKDWKTTRSKSTDHVDTIAHPHIVVKQPSKVNKPPLAKSVSSDLKPKPAVRRHTLTSLPLSSNPAAVVKDASLNVCDDKQLPAVKRVFNHSAHHGVHMAPAGHATSAPSASSLALASKDSNCPNKPSSELDKKIEETMRLCERLSLEAANIASNPAT